ncbi:hypothetical protein MMC20_000536 [Loxospora ochrophaea]|nr:hypothetical protein [Loxospora ochrophaea]
MAIYKILGYNDKWSRAVDTSEKGNLDYLMFANLEYGHPEVQQDVKRWGEWLGKEVKIRGMRLDAVRHISADFLTDFIRHLERTVGGANWFFVGEFWKNDVGSLRKYIDRMNHRVSLFDVPLIYNFLSISRTKAADLTKVFDNTLVKAESNHAVTIVMNHDTQPFQTLEAIIAPYFKPLAYALILLRQSGRPCVFYGDLYGIQGEHPFPISCNGKLPDLCLARKLYAYGKQHDYFDSPHCIGWTREGTWDRPSGLACVMSNWRPNQKIMFVGKRHAGEVWTDSLGWHQGRVVIDRMGFGTFPCAGASVSVWIHLTAEGRDKLGSL